MGPSLPRGVVVCTARLAKGLEFDNVGRRTWQSVGRSVAEARARQRRNRREANCATGRERTADSQLSRVHDAE
jgi:hypothetical protein